MARGILWIVLTVCALLLAGCSSHPPSAAQFMNMERNGGALAIGATARAGDNLEKRRVEDSFYNEGYWNLDFSILCRFFNFAMIGASFENIIPRGVLGLAYRYVGFQGWVGATSPNSSKDSPFTGGVMLIENFPISDNFRIGLSEHFSRNALDVSDPNLYGASSAYYNEFGVGAYMTFMNFSLEFRYGREIRNPNNRFYFTLNYQFYVVKEKTEEEKQRRRELKAALKKRRELKLEIQMRKEELKWKMNEDKLQGVYNEEKFEEEKIKIREMRDSLDAVKVKIRELD